VIHGLLYDAAHVFILIMEVVHASNLVHSCFSLVETFTCFIEYCYHVFKYGFMALLHEITIVYRGLI
jgi:hypothetical protein